MAEPEPKVTQEETEAGPLPSVLDKAKETPGILAKPKESQVWKSIIRHKLDKTPRNRETSGEIRAPASGLHVGNRNLWSPRIARYATAAGASKSREREN